jgi:predicted ArsR family transcriptional regulator
MGTTNLDKRFFESTRGKIVMLLRAASRTVHELASELGLTTNAVRAHLLVLERDKLVTSAGSIKGFRKPHSTYRLTDEARHLFPKSYDSLFIRLIGVLKQRIKPSPLKSIFDDVGTELAGDDQSQLSSEQRIDKALDSLKAMGGAPRLLNKEGQVFIESESCPFAEAVSEHPEVCKIAESMLEKVIGKKVNETCDRSATPKCCFAIES